MGRSNHEDRQKFFVSGKTIVFEAAFYGYNSRAGNRRLTLEVDHKCHAEMAILEASEGFRLKVTVEIQTSETIGGKHEKEPTQG